jgi:hypothetical protein
MLVIVHEQPAWRRHGDAEVHIAELDDLPRSGIPFRVGFRVAAQRKHGRPHDEDER